VRPTRKEFIRRVVAPRATNWSLWSASICRIGGTQTARPSARWPNYSLWDECITVKSGLIARRVERPDVSRTGLEKTAPVQIIEAKPGFGIQFLRRGKSRKKGTAKKGMETFQGKEGERSRSPVRGVLLHWQRKKAQNARLRDGFIEGGRKKGRVSSLEKLRDQERLQEKKACSPEHTRDAVQKCGSRQQENSKS